jgi:hypothetical protein
MQPRSQGLGPRYRRATGAEIKTLGTSFQLIEYFLNLQSTYPVATSNEILT